MSSCEGSLSGMSDDERGPRPRSRPRPRPRLDPGGRLNLREVLISFNGPVSEEQAWAICYQTARRLDGQNLFLEMTDLSQILLHKDGDVFLGENADSRKPTIVSEQKAVFCLGMMIFKALDYGLDDEEERPLSPDLEALITLMTNSEQECEGETEDRPQETDDEGIERDSSDTGVEEFLNQRTTDTYQEPFSVYSFKNVMQMCTRHMETTVESAEAHYKAVIRAFVAEALELSQFLDTVEANKLYASQNEVVDKDNQAGSTSLQHLDALDLNDWARFWVQVIQELRRGVKLKKVEANLGTKSGPSRGRGKGAEFELTPYEILMNDIRERRYNLRKTPLPGTHYRKDAHAVILEFIRSRPPLKKASERRLPPRQKEWTLRELLMESIKKPPNLRPSRTRNGGQANKQPSPVNDQTQTSAESKENESPTAPKPPRRELESSNGRTGRTRKVIPVDFDLKLDAEDEDEDEDYNEEFPVTRFEEEDEASNYWHLKEYARPGTDRQDQDDEAGSANPWRKTGGLRLTRNEYHRFCDTQLESYDLATQCPSRRVSVRKHAARRSVALSALCGTASLPHSRPQSRQQQQPQQQQQHHHLTESSTISQGPSPNISLNPSPSLSPQPRARLPRRSHTIAHDRASDTNEEQNNEDWQEETTTSQKPSLGDMFLDERLSLTLEEIVHIRSVLTKAELESLPVEGRVKEDVEKRRVCFLCLKTRFGLLGPWGQRCRLCERTVCVKCYSKMRIPTEHFAHVPVVLLSPGLLLSPSSSEPDTGSKGSWLRGNGAAGSAPASPASRRKDSSSLRNMTPASTPTTTPVLILTPTSTPPSQSHSRRDADSQERRSLKSTGSPAGSGGSRPFTGFSGHYAEQRLVADRLRGVAMVVCHDCRIMVIQIIKSSRTTRATIRNNVISRLTLNLSPAYV